MPRPPAAVSSAMPPQIAPSESPRPGHPLSTAFSGASNHPFDIVRAAWQIAGRMTAAEAHASLSGEAEKEAVAGAGADGKRRRPKYLQSASRVTIKTIRTIDAAEEWRALPVADKLRLGMERFADARSVNRTTMCRYVDFDGNWMIPVPGHEHEYRPRQEWTRQLSAEKKQLVNDYCRSHPGPINPSDLVKYLESRGIDNFECVHHALRHRRIAGRAVAPPRVPATEEELLAMLNHDQQAALFDALDAVLAEGVAANPLTPSHR